jgi:2-dehydro-3-deoxyphosphogluconate aldolase/(4S)-4-hydroxy-2-oxoglutarate aldolase
MSAAMFPPAPVIPVVTLTDEREAETLGEALLAGGLPVAEVVLRTPGSLVALRRLAEEPGLTIGAGTVLTPGQLADAAGAGAAFIVSPGLTDSLADAAADARLPFLPGAVTASEIMRALDLGLRMVKFFPAATSGGPAAIAALAAPFPSMRFVPTGGIGPDAARSYLELEAVAAVGGSWMVPRALLAAGDAAGLTGLVAAAVEATAAI